MTNVICCQYSGYTALVLTIRVTASVFVTADV